MYVMTYLKKFKDYIKYKIQKRGYIQNCIIIPREWAILTNIDFNENTPIIICTNNKQIKIIDNFIKDWNTLKDNQSDPM